jgi:signal transduction histidine kinase
MSAAGSIRVLLVEDSAADAERIERELKTAGIVFTTRRTETRELFLKALQEFRPDIVLSQYKLSQFSALEALDLLRQSRPDIPLLLVTETRSDEEAVECLQKGAARYILKRNLTRLPSELLHTLTAKESERARKESEQELRSYNDELRAFSAHLQSLREQERNRLAQEIHDELAQTLTALRWDITWLQNKISTTTDERVLALQEHLREMAVHADSTVKCVRRILDDLRPRVQEGFGLIPAIESHIEEFEKRTGVRCTFTPGIEELTLDPESMTEVFRFLQETLSNITRHANASEVSVSLAVEGERLIFSVEDNGKGIVEQTITGDRPTGLRVLRDRARSLGGTVTVGGRPDGGTTIRLEIPIRSENRA